jgi:transposase-like protein
MLFSGSAGEGIMATAKKTYTPQFKFQVVLESLKNERSDGEIARMYGVHPITLSNWKRHFMEHGVEVFGGSEAMKQAENRQAELERLLGQKEVEIALLRNFLKGR